MTHQWRKIALSFVLFGLALTKSVTATAAPREPQRWAPTGKWFVNFGQDRCLASRPFGRESKTITLGIERVPMKDWIKFLLEAPGTIDNFDIRSAQVHFGGKPIPIQGLFVEWSEQKGNLIYSFYVPEADLMAQSSTFDLSIKSSSLFAQLPVANLPGVTKALGECMSSFLANWGLSPSAQAALKTFPEPLRPISAYFSNDDYPSSALRRLAIGRIDARIMVQINGNPVDCKVIRSSGHPDLDQITCANVLKRAHFKPALDRAGKPMQSPFFFSTRWMIPG